MRFLSMTDLIDDVEVDGLHGEFASYGIQSGNGADILFATDYNGIRGAGNIGRIKLTNINLQNIRGTNGGAKIKLNGWHRDVTINAPRFGSEPINWFHHIALVARIESLTILDAEVGDHTTDNVRRLVIGPLRRYNPRPASFAVNTIPSSPVRSQQLRICVS
jgi:hypothetical protein